MVEFTGEICSAHEHAASDITSGTFADALIAESNITQHEAAITHANIIAGDGTDHTYINQDVTTLATPSFAGMVLGNHDLDCSAKGQFGYLCLVDNPSVIMSSYTLNFQVSNDEDDYLTLSTVSHVPTLGTVGACNLSITSSGGTIDFDDENLTTTGTITAEDILIGNGRYIGSVSDPDAIQIEADGDIVMLQDLSVGGTLTASHIIITGLQWNVTKLQYQKASTGATWHDVPTV